jgi:RNA polymerase sigma factor (sigma-70 family)
MNEQRFISEILPFKQKIFRLALKMLVNRQDAEDATQEVFLKLWSIAEKLDEHPNVEAFAVLMTKNLCIDKQRKRKFKTEELNTDITADRLNPEKIAIQKNFADIVKGIISELPPQQKLVIHLRDVEEFELPQIAEIAGMSEVTVRVTLSRARKKIRETFYERYKNERY